MSAWGDSGSEMFRRHLLDDDTIEAVLSGESPSADGLLTSFAEDVRLAGTATVPNPSTALAAVLAEGFSTDKGDLPVTAARTRRTPAEVMSRLGARAAGWGLAAKVGLGLGVALTGVTAAGAVGVLPDAADNGVRGAIESVTPFEFPDDAADESEFGETVSTDATDGEEPGVDGSTVADDAQDQGAGAGAGVSDEAEVGTVPEDAGSTGIDQADETPAEPYTPDSVPGSSDTADEYTPESVPGSSDTADEYRPSDVPDGAPEETPDGRP